MGYINDFRAKLQQLIEDGETEQALKYAADTVLESYRNGKNENNGEQRSTTGARGGEKPRTFPPRRLSTNVPQQARRHSPL